MPRSSPSRHRPAGPGVVAALAALVIVPSLIAFAQGSLSAFGLAERYRVAVVLVGLGTAVVSGLWKRYSSQAQAASQEDEEPDPARSTP
ncbi:MAG: hypothetical protein ACRD0J_10010 [Acidimicrobiales bacterium]